MTTSLENQNDASEALLRFFDSMERWESDSRKVMKDIEAGLIDADGGLAAIRSEVSSIFSQFCSTMPAPTRFDPGRLQFGAHEPSYGRTREKIAEVRIRGDNAEILTSRKGPPAMKLVYNLVRKGNEWRVVDNRRRVKPDGTTVPWDL